MEISRVAKHGQKHMSAKAVLFRSKSGTFGRAMELNSRGEGPITRTGHP